jgi:hypothetical protein
VEVPVLVALDRKIIRSVSALNRRAMWRDVLKEAALLLGGEPNSEVLIEAKSPLLITKPPLRFQVPHYKCKSADRDKTRDLEI